MEMSHNARVILRENLKAQVEQFHGSHDQTSHGNRSGVKKNEEGFIGRLLAKGKENQAKQTAMFEKIVADEKTSKLIPPSPSPTPSPFGKYSSKEELEAHEGMSARTFVETSGRMRAEKYPSDHGMTQREYIEARALGGAKKAQNDHPMTVREFIKATGRGQPEKAPNDHPMTMWEFVEYSGRGGSKSSDLRKNSPNDHPMTEDEFRKAMGLPKKKK